LLSDIFTQLITEPKKHPIRAMSPECKEIGNFQIAMDTPPTAPVATEYFTPRICTTIFDDVFSLYNYLPYSADPKKHLHRQVTLAKQITITKTGRTALLMPQPTCVENNIPGCTPSFVK